MQFKESYETSHKKNEEEFIEQYLFSAPQNMYDNDGNLDGDLDGGGACIYIYEGNFISINFHSKVM